MISMRMLGCSFLVCLAAYAQAATSVAHDDAFTVYQDTSGNALLVQINDENIDRRFTTVVAKSLPAHGTITANSNFFRYTPTPGYVGPDDFTYADVDGGVESNTATVNLTVLANSAPVANNDAYSIHLPLQTNIFANDSDADGNVLTLNIKTLPEHGTLDLGNKDGNIYYSPEVFFSGEVTFTYAAFDGHVESNIATVTINVQADGFPIGVDDRLTIDEDASAIAIDVLANDGDPDGDPIFLEFVNTAQHGQTAMVNGKAVYQPEPNYSGTDSFSYNLNDGYSGTSARVDVVINAVNDAPVAQNDVVSMPMNSVAAIGALANDSDVDSTLSLLSFTQGSHGHTFANGNDLSYRANFGYSGTDSFTYTVSDGDLTATATVYVTINAPSNNAPVAVNDSATIAEDSGTTTITVLDNDSDPDGNAIFVSVVGSAQHGTTDKTDGTVTYQPDAGYNGSDSFTYTISDGSLTATATVSVTIVPVSDAQAADDSYTVHQNNLSVFPVLTNDTYSGSVTVVLKSPAAHGSVSVDTKGGSQQFFYTSSGAYFGPDTFTYAIRENGAESNLATVNITIRTNAAPVATDDSANVTSGATFINASQNDSDPDGDVLYVADWSEPAHGTIALVVNAANGNEFQGFNYTPNFGYAGSDSFTYSIHDGFLTSNVATVSITVIADNQAPAAANDSLVVNEDAAATVVNVLANDTDANGDALTVTGVGSGAKGSATLNGGVIQYQPNADANGSDSFAYSISDGHGGTASATVNVTITPVNDAPTAANDSLTVAEDANATAVDVSGNDGDIDSATLTVTAVGAASKGIASLNAGVVSYKPNANANGSDFFTYTISDGSLTANATVSITITSVNDAPIALNDAATVAPNGSVAVTVLANDSDVDGDTLSVTTFDATSTAGGKITKSGNVLTYAPKKNFTGSDSFNYNISDGKGGAASARVIVTVANPPPPPANDNFANAIAINTSTSASATGSNVLATKEAGEYNHGLGLGVTSSGQSVWWTWKAPNGKGSAGNVSITTAGSSFDTVLAVYVKGTQMVKVGNVVLKANNDNAGGTPQSGVSFAISAGQIYYIAVDGVAGSAPTTGNVKVNVSFIPTGTG